MTEPRWESCTEEEVWKYVAWHLAKNGIETILVDENGKLLTQRISSLARSGISLETDPLVWWYLKRL
ncbi:hypothetical protein D3C87_339210 [compost metagenome]